MNAYYNNIVDLEDKKAVCADAFDMWQSLGNIYKVKQKHQELIKQYHDFLIAMYEQLSEAKALDGKPIDVMPDFHARAQVGSVVTQQTMLTDEILQSCPYGHTFALRFATWWCELQWCEGSAISFHELYISFCMSTRTMAPVVLGQKKYALRDQSHEANIAPLALSLQVTMWDRMIMWWMRHSCHPLTIQKVDALHVFGYSYRVKGFHARPKLDNAVEVATELWKYFHPSGEGYTIRCFKRAWCVQANPHAAYGGSMMLKDEMMTT